MLHALLTYTHPIVVPLPFIGRTDISGYIVAFALFVLLIVFFWALRNVVISRLQALSKKTRTDIDDMLINVVGSVRPWVYTLISLYIVLRLFVLPPWLNTTATAVFLLVLVWQIIEGIAVIVDYGATRILEKDEDGDGVVDPNAATASNMVTLLARIVLWSLGGLFILSNLGIEVTSLIAGLGIGGLAIAFALQNILADLFSSFSIYFDKPFRVGDYIVIGEHSGTVERIGIKTTRLRTLQGEELVVSNAELTASRVQNFKKMRERRIAFTFGITYETPHEKVSLVPKLVREVFDRVAGGRLDRAHFTSFGDSALMFEVVYYVESPDYATYLDIQQSANLGLMDAFAKEDIAFAYPTQMLYMKKLI